MKVEKNIKHVAGYMLIISMLVLLPGCRFVDWMKEKFGGASPAPTNTMTVAEVATPAADGSAVLVTMAGKPLITQTMLDAEKQKLMASNPQLQAMIAMMDEKQLNRNLVDGMASREIIRKYVTDNKIDATDKYKQDFEMVLNQVRDALNTRYFMDAFSVQVADNEIKKFYEENKDAIPNLLVSRGGVEAIAASFADQKAANDFMAKVRATKNDINRAAKEAGIVDKVQDFKLVNEQSLGMDPELRDKIVSIKAVPSLSTFKIGNEFWVVAANKKEAPQYRELDQVKDELKQMIEKEKTMKKFEEEVARLKGEYGIEVNEEFFAPAPDVAKTVQVANELALPRQEKKAVKTADASSKKPKANIA